MYLRNGVKPPPKLRYPQQPACRLTEHLLRLIKDFLALLPQFRRNSDQQEHQRGQQHERRYRVDNRNGRIPAREQERPAQIFLQHRPKNESKQQRCRLTSHTSEQIAHDAKEGGDVDLERLLLNRIKPNDAEATNFDVIAGVCAKRVRLVFDLDVCLAGAL